MIIVQDNYLDKEDFEWLQDYCDKTEFQYINGGDKEFLAINTPERILEHLEIVGYDIIFSFIRKAHKDFDNDHRIHSDGIILGHYTHMASVIYLNDEDGVTPNGTMFYEHEEHGKGLPENVSPEVYDKVLGDSNKIGMFEERDRIYSKPNRALNYDASLFHAKFPKVIEKGERIVLVTFYTENRE